MSAFSIATFNMQFGQVWEPNEPDHAPVDMEGSIAFLKAAEADVLLLQEVERVDPTRQQIDPPPNFMALSAALSGYEGFFSYPRQDDRELPFGYALAIFSRFPLQHREIIHLPAPDLEFNFEGQPTRPTDRVMIGARIELEGRTLQLFNTHLQAFFMIGSSADDYPAQRETVGQSLLQSRHPAIIGGDFNISPEDGTLNYFEGLGYRPAQRKTITWKRKPYVTDHLLYNAGLALEAVSVIPTETSDHEMVKGIFSIV